MDDGQVPSVVLGIDPGTTRMGYGVVASDGELLTALDFGIIKTRSTGSLSDRLADIYFGVSDLVERFRPHVGVVEKLFFTRNVQTALAVGHARGVAMLALAHGNVPVVEYTPQAIKAAVSGYGKGGKEQVQTMVRLLLSLEANPEPDDAADALAAAICHLHIATKIQRLAAASRA